MAAVSRATERGKEKHMLFGDALGSGASAGFVHERSCCRIDDCQTIRRSHCCVTSRSAFWMSVGSGVEGSVLPAKSDVGERGRRKMGGRARRFWSATKVAALTRGSEPSFQAVTKDSSRGVYDETSWRKPAWMSGDSYEWRVEGSEGVCLNVMGLLRRMAKELQYRQ
ncbi:hypothetical protein HYQ46_008193 [Verticillium longisporum]|nr:hypothetical protein HYQ46_008193 [Verticillium longisporum]